MTWSDIKWHGSIFCTYHFIKAHNHGNVVVVAMLLQCFMFKKKKNKCHCNEMKMNRSNHWMVLKRIATIYFFLRFLFKKKSINFSGKKNTVFPPVPSFFLVFRCRTSPSSTMGHPFHHGFPSGFPSKSSRFVSFRAQRIQNGLSSPWAYRLWTGWNHQTRTVPKGRANVLLTT